MIETIKIIHISCALLSILGFISRASLMVLDSPWLQHKIAKRLPHLIDTLLLLSGIAMLINLGLTPWLIAKLIAVLLYIGLGFIALRFGPNKSIRTMAAVAAILVFTYIASVAMTKAPLIF